VLSLQVNTRGCGFTETPAYVTAIYGKHNHWLLQGASIVYAPTRDQVSSGGGHPTLTSNTSKQTK
jgi:hypothetical protein